MNSMNRFILNVSAVDTGIHYCRVELPETNPAEAIAKALVIRQLFGAGFECSLTRWNDIGLAIQLPAWGQL